MKRRSRVVAEFRTIERRVRAGFVTSYEDAEPELWTIWAKSDAGADRRATVRDLSRAGFTPRKTARRG